MQIRIWRRQVFFCDAYYFRLILQWRSQRAMKRQWLFKSQDTLHHTSTAFVWSSGGAAGEMLRCHLHAWRFEVVAFQKLTIPTVAVCQNCQNVEQNSDKGLRFIQLINPVSLSIKKNVSPAAVLLLSGGWSGDPRHRIHLLRCPASPWTQSSQDLVQSHCER